VHRGGADRRANAGAFSSRTVISPYQAAGRL
jgi:hypothetical protein